MKEELIMKMERPPTGLFIEAMPYRWPYDGDLRPGNTALIVIDMQIDFCGEGGYVDKMGYDISLTRKPIAPLKRLFAAMRAAFPDLRIRIDEQIGEQDKVMTRKTFEGTHRGEFLGVPGSGNRVAFEVIDILSVRDDGRITDHRVIVDKLGLLQQLGVSAP